MLPVPEAPASGGTVAGHSKWANIKRRKGAQDQARGKLFTKLIKEIQVAAKLGGPDIDANARLRLAVDKARSQSMPKATIERAIAKASGELTGSNYDEITYEGYGPGGIAVLVEALTDNRNRSSSEVRHAFTKSGGNLGTSGSVGYMFQRKGVFTLSADAIDEDTLMLEALEGGADDVERADDLWVVTCAFEAYDSCKKALQALDVELATAEIQQIPDNMVTVTADDAEKVIRLIETLDNLDDVQDTWTNAEFPS